MSSHQDPKKLELREFFINLSKSASKNGCSEANHPVRRSVHYFLPLDAHVSEASSHRRHSDCAATYGGSPYLTFTRSRSLVPDRSSPTCSEPASCLLSSSEFVHPIPTTSSSSRNSDLRGKLVDSNEDSAFASYSVSSSPQPSARSTPPPVSSLNQELVSLGLPSLRIRGDVAVDFQSAQGMLWTVLQQYRSMVNHRNSLEDRLVEAQGELNQQRKRASRLDGAVEQQNRTIQEKIQQNRELHETCHALQAELRAEKSEHELLKATASQRNDQSRHDLRKDEQEIHRLKETLEMMIEGVVGKGSGQRAAMEIISSFDGCSSASASSSENNCFCSRRSFHRTLVLDMESKLNEVIRENKSLRDVIAGVMARLDEVISQLIQGEVAPRPNIGYQLKSWLYLPLDVIRTQLDKQLGQRWAALHDAVLLLKTGALENSSTSSYSPDTTLREQDTDAIDSLKKKISNYEEIFRNQDEILQVNKPTSRAAMTTQGSAQTLLFKSDPSDNTFLMDSYFIEEREQIENERRQLDSERETFRKERATYADAVVRLARERQAFETERLSLLEPAQSDAAEHTFNAGPLTSSHSVNALPDSGDAQERNVCPPPTSTPRINGSKHTKAIHCSEDAASPLARKLPTNRGASLSGSATYKLPKPSKRINNDSSSKTVINPRTTNPPARRNVPLTARR